jgi:transcription initiation factor IIF auxiliary subunit
VWIPSPARKFNRNSTIWGCFSLMIAVFLTPDHRKSNLDNLLGGKHPVKLDHGGWGSIEL